MPLRIRADAGDLHPVEGRVATTSPNDSPGLDARGLVAAPGLVDLQVNGAHGVDITAEPERLWEVAAALPTYGVAAFLPALISSDRSARDHALATLAAGPHDGWRGAVPLGLHLEGPMIGHTDATAEQTRSAVEAGATCVTHLFSAMRPLHHREPGPVGEVLDSSVVAGVLVDGHHLAPEGVRLAWEGLGPARFLIITDATAALGSAAWAASARRAGDRGA